MYDDYDGANEDGYSEGIREGRNQALRERLEEFSDEEILAALNASRREKIVDQLDPYNNYGTEYVDDDGEFQIDFSQPGSNSALRAAHAGNPRILPCPNCYRPNQLTPADRTRHYVCDGCADARERGGWGYGEY